MTAVTDRAAGCAYAVDGQDRIAAVDEAWRLFAQQNEGESLFAQHVLRRSLWDYIRGIENRLIYKRLLDHVRGGGEPVSFELRCDGPTMERKLQMEIVPLPENGCLFRTHMLQCNPRDPVPLLSRRVERSTASLPVCDWCMQAEVLGHWVDLVEAVDRLREPEAQAWPLLTHTICPACFERLDTLLSSTRLSWRRSAFGAISGQRL